MKLFFTFLAFFIFNVSAHAQNLSSFEGMSSNEVRSYLINQQSSDLAQDYALKHRDTRKTAYGFMIASGVLAGAAYLYQATATPSEESIGAVVGQVIKFYALAGASGLAIITSAVLHSVSRNQLSKAKKIYLGTYNTSNSTTLAVGISISF